MLHCHARLSLRTWWFREGFALNTLQLLISVDFWYEYAARLILINWEYVHLFRIIVARARSISPVIWCWNLWLGLGEVPRKPLLFLPNGLHDVIVARTYSIALSSSMDLLCVSLLNKLSVIIFLISKDILVGWDRRRVLQLIPIDLLPFRLRTHFLWLRPVLFLIILAWPGGIRVLFETLIRETIDFGGEAIWRFNDSYSKLLQPVHLQSLRWLDTLAHLVEP